MGMTIGFLAFLASIAVIGDYPKCKLVSEYKWLLFAPIIGFLAVSYSIFLDVNTNVPHNENVTKLVKVEDEDGEVYYWNLLIDVDSDTDDDGHMEYLAYEVRGYVSPKNGKIIKVDPYGYECFGTEASFYDCDKDGFQYKTVVNKQDVDVSIIERVTAMGTIKIILYICMFFVSLYAIFISIKVFKLLKAGERK